MVFDEVSSLWSLEKEDLLDLKEIENQIKEWIAKICPSKEESKDSMIQGMMISSMIKHKVLGK